MHSFVKTALGIAAGAERLPGCSAASSDKEQGMNIFVGNIAFTASEDDLRQLFEEHGVVDEVHLITDRYTGRSRGFGFVGYPLKAGHRYTTMVSGL